jgi:hypothetical protein
MKNWLRMQARRAPRRFVVAGKTLLLVGAILVLAAVFARAGLISLNSERAAAKLPAIHTLAEAWPQYPTWLVPEGPVGFTLAGLLVLLGTGLAVLGDAAQKEERVRRGAHW